MLASKSRQIADTVRKLLARQADANALHILTQLHPSEIADILGQLPFYRKAAFQLLFRHNVGLAVEALSELGRTRGADLLTGLTVQEIARVLGQLDRDDAAAFMSALPDDVQDQLMVAMKNQDAAELQDLLQYPEKTAGRIMNPRVFSLSEDTTVEEAIRRLRGAGDLEMVFYIYVVDRRGHLVGVLSLRQLLRRPEDTRLEDIMTRDVVRVSTEADQEEVARLVASYNVLAIPVVDSTNFLVGAITVDDVIDVIEDEATEDMYRLAGLDVQERVFTPPRSSARMRLPWLAVNLATAFLAALVVSLFEDTIRQYAILAVFMPVVAGMGGNAGTQTLTVMVRGIALGELHWSNSRKAVLKEILVGILNGLVIGSFVAVVGLAWKGNPMLGVVLGLALMGNLLVAAVAGTVVPLTLKWLNIDPALASSVFVTTCTDVFGFLFYLGLATLVLHHLI